MEKKREDELIYCLFLKSGKFLMVDSVVYDMYRVALSKKDKVLMWGEEFEIGRGCISMENIEAVVKSIHFKQAL